MSFFRTSLFAASAIALAACSSGDAATNDANADTAADGDTAAAEVLTSGNYTLTPVATGLEVPWGMAFLPSGDLLVTEREGRLTLVRDGENTTVSGTPETLVDGQGGYLGLLLDPEFETNRTFYMAFSKGTKDSNSTAVYKGVLSADGTEVTSGEVIYEATKRNTTYHFGGRLQFMADGTLLVSLGDGFRYMDEAQNTNNTHGKIVRINTDGTIPTNNPFADGDAPEVYSYGHRNVQGLYVDPETDTVYAHEHGPKGGDEFNVIEPGNNYGWPVITYGINYNGTIITEETARDGMEQPVEKWVPSIAPSGMIKYTGGAYEGWQGDFFVGAMNGPEGQKLVRLDMEDGEYVGKEDLLGDLQLPFRDVIQGPDGKLYLAGAQAEDNIYRLDLN